MSKAKAPVELGLIAQSAIKRIQDSSARLAEEVTFKCDACKDTHFVLKEGRFAHCKCVFTSKSEPKKKFF